MLIILSSCKTEQSTFVLKCGLPTPLCFTVRFQGSTFTLQSAINPQLWYVSEASSIWVENNTIK